jgi:hypothetical protein
MVGSCASTRRQHRCRPGPTDLADRAPPLPPHHGRYRTPVGDDGDVAIAVGAPHRHAEPGQFGQQHRRRVSVVVVSPHADHRDVSVDGGEKAGVEVGRTVVRNFEHVGSKVGAGCHQRLLGVDLGVTGQHDALAVDRGPQDQRRVVRVGSSVVERDARGQDVEVYPADVESLTDRRCADSQAAPLQRRLHEVDAGRGFGQRAGQNRVDATAGKDAGDAADMVEVIMREDQQWDVSDAEVVQAAVDGHGIRTGVDFDRRVRRGGKQEGVALSDIAGHEHPVRRRPAGCDRPNRDQDDDRGNCGRRQAAPRPGPRRGRQYTDEEHEKRQAAGQAAGPGQGRAVQGAEEVRHPHQPATRPACQPGQQLGRRQPQWCHDGRREAEDGRDRHHGLGQDVGRD